MIEVFKMLSIIEAVLIALLVIALIVQKIKSAIAYDILLDDAEEERVVAHSYYKGQVEKSETRCSQLEVENGKLRKALQGSEDKRTELLQRLNERMGA